VRREHENRLKKIILHRFLTITGVIYIFFTHKWYITLVVHGNWCYKPFLKLINLFFSSEAIHITPVGLSNQCNILL